MGVGMPGSMWPAAKGDGVPLMVREHLRGLTGSKSTKEGSQDSCPGGGAELEVWQQGGWASPEHLVADVLIRDATVHQVLVPHGIQSVPLRLRFQLIGLRCGDEGFSMHVP